MTVPTNEQHVPIQKRRGFACEFCRQPMEPGTPQSTEKCPAREAREQRTAGDASLARIRAIGRQMQPQRDSKGTKKRAPRTRKANAH